MGHDTIISSEDSRCGCALGVTDEKCEEPPRKVPALTMIDRDATRMARSPCVQSAFHAPVPDGSFRAHAAAHPATTSTSYGARHGHPLKAGGTRARATSPLSRPDQP